MFERDDSSDPIMIETTDSSNPITSRDSWLIGSDSHRDSYSSDPAKFPSSLQVTDLSDFAKLLSDCLSERIKGMASKIVLPHSTFPRFGAQAFLGPTPKESFD